MIVIILKVLINQMITDEDWSATTAQMVCGTKNSTASLFSLLVEILLFKFYRRDIWLRLSTTITWLLNNSYDPYNLYILSSQTRSLAEALIVIFSGENTMAWNVEKHLIVWNPCSLAPILAEFTSFTKFACCSSLRCDKVWVILLTSWPYFFWTRTKGCYALDISACRNKAF